MLNTITWQGYWTVLAVLTAGYYLAIYLFYFRKDFKIRPLGRQVTAAPSATSFSSCPPQKERDQATAFVDDEWAFQTPPDGDEKAVYACMDEVNAYLEEVKKTKCVKSELLYALQRILSRYNHLKDSPYKESISNVIVSEAAHQCALHLSADDMVNVWAGS